MVNKGLISVVVVTRNRKHDLLVCLEAIYAQNYKNIEIILVNNASTDSTSYIIRSKFPKITLINNSTNVGAAEGRNLGLNRSGGKYILFLDDDTKADPDMITNLKSVIESDSTIGIVQPKIYEMGKKKMLQGVGHGINLLTGRVYGIGVHIKDTGQFEQLMDIPMAGCTWMVKRKVFNKIGKYDKDFFIPYEDSDFSQRAREAGFRVCFVPSAVIYHRGVKTTTIDPHLEWIGVTTPERAYRVSRNKIMFMKKHAPALNLLIFLFIFTPVYALLHTMIIISSKRLDILIDYWKGLFSGFGYVLFKS